MNKLPIDHSELAELRRRWGSVYIASPSPDHTFVYRGLTWDEYDDILEDSTISDFYKEELIVKAGVLYPVDIDPDELDELVGGLANAILEVSYFYSPEQAQQLLDEKREDTTSARHTMKTIVLACYDFLGLRESDVDALTFEQLCEKVVLAEKVIELQKLAFNPELASIPRINFTTQDEEPSAPTAQQARYGTSAYDPEGTSGTNPDKPSGGTLAEDPIAKKLRQTLQ